MKLAVDCQSLMIVSRCRDSAQSLNICYRLDCEVTYSQMQHFVHCYGTKVQ